MGAERPEKENDYRRNCFVIIKLHYQTRKMMKILDKITNCGNLGASHE